MKKVLFVLSLRGLIDIFRRSFIVAWRSEKNVSKGSQNTTPIYHETLEMGVQNRPPSVYAAVRFEGETVATHMRKFRTNLNV